MAARAGSWQRRRFRAAGPRSPAPAWASAAPRAQTGHRPNSLGAARKCAYAAPSRQKRSAAFAPAASVSSLLPSLPRFLSRLAALKENIARTSTIGKKKRGSLPPDEKPAHQARVQVSPVRLRPFGLYYSTTRTRSIALLARNRRIGLQASERRASQQLHDANIVLRRQLPFFRLRTDNLAG